MMVKKLLLLGAGESGKSTLFKQLDNIYGDGFTKEEVVAYVAVIHSNMIESIKMLIQVAPEFGEGLAMKCETEAGFLSKLDENDSLENAKGAEMKYGEAIRKVWQDDAIQAAYKNRSRFQLTDSTKYYLDMAETICAPGWLPNKDDMLRARIRTTGIVEKAFQIANNKFLMFDVGGQRNERKKWIHCFDSVTAVLFVGVLSEYDQMLFEDSNMNRMEETLNLFREMCHNKYFANTAMILFLNKRDLFKDKIENGQNRLNDCPAFRKKAWNRDSGSNDGEYTDEEIESMFPKINTYDGGRLAIEHKFLEQNTNEDKLIYPHHTCATDTNNIMFVFDAVREIIIQGALGDAGLC